MRTSPVVLWLMVFLLIGATWALTGCAPEDDSLEELPPDPDAPVEEAPEAEAEAEGEEIAPDLEPERELTPEQAEAALGVEVDLNRAYPETAFQPLRTVMYVGTEEQKAQVRDRLEQLLLRSNVMVTRAGAASVLGIDPAGSEAALTEAALNDPEKLVRQQAIDALAGAPSSPELLSALAKAQNAEDPEIRNTALMAEMDVRLGAMTDMTDTAWMARLLGQRRDDASAQMQIKLVQQGPRYLPAAIHVLQTADSEDARAAAATVVMCICAGTSPKQEKFAEFSQAIIKEGLPEPEPANLDGLAPLENAVANDSSWKVRAVAAQGLGYLGQESSARVLGNALIDENEEVRWWAALALETVPSTEAVADLSRAATRDSSTRVREAAVRALGWAESEDALRPLIRATADESSAVRQAAAQELARYASPVSLQALVRLFKDPNEDVRWAAVVAAGDLRDEETVPALIDAMRDPSPMVSNAAERALQRMGRAERRFGLESET
ncbi:MAG: HEAT repeat domain-containing protein [Armatimonadota bacterium]|jgi:HEAT repeat protein